MRSEKKIISKGLKGSLGNLIEWFGGLGTVLTIPILTLLSRVKSGWAAFGLMMAGLMI